MAGVPRVACLPVRWSKLRRDSTRRVCVGGSKCERIGASVAFVVTVKLLVECYGDASRVSLKLGARRKAEDRVEIMQPEPLMKSAVASESRLTTRHVPFDADAGTFTGVRV